MGDVWDAIKTAVEVVGAALIALFSFDKLGTDAIKGVQQLPDLHAKHRIEKFRRNQE